MAHINSKARIIVEIMVLTDKEFTELDANITDTAIRACSDPELTDITTAAPLGREDITDSKDLLQVVL